MGNIYASEALFRAGISPSVPAFELSMKQVTRLWKSIRKVLGDAIKRGSSQPLDYEGSNKRDSHFYFGSSSETAAIARESFLVYDRSSEPCFVCGVRIRRCVQAARSTFYCPRCQPSKRAPGSRLVAKNLRGK
jgi:formamidopyrimidine-DNA glycosylase